MEEIRILSTSSFGFGISGESWDRGLSWEPHAIIAQGTSSDGGPSYLGSDADLVGPIGIKRDLKTIITSAKSKGIPFILSSGSPSGANKPLEKALELVNEISVEENLKLDVAVIPGEIDKEYLKRKIINGARIRRLVDTEQLPEYLSIKDVDESERIVAQMGPEPIIKALGLNVDGVITGRALDVGLYLALPMMQGYDKGLAAHLAKTIECSGLVTVPQTSSVFGTLRKDYFLVRPTSPQAKCTIISVAAHSFYERPNPNLEENPGGTLDITDAVYEQIDEETVKVSGSRWIPRPYTLKLEGVTRVGYRTICICGIRDNNLIKAIDIFLEQTRKHVEEIYDTGEKYNNYNLMFRVYGKNGVLGEAEPIKQTQSHELGLVVDAFAHSQELASAVCTSAVDAMAHMDYPGRIATAANLAFPYSPRESKLGEVYIYNIWHLLELDDPCEPFQIQVRHYPY